MFNEYDSMYPLEGIDNYDGKFISNLPNFESDKKID